MLKKALISIGIPLCFLFLVIWLFFSYSGPSTKPPEEVKNPFPISATTTTTASVPQGEGLSLPGRSGLVETKNFYKSATEITPQNDALITDDPEFQILYYTADSSFFITLLKTPLEATRQKAETELLNKLGISKEDACRLRVAVGAPYWVDEVRGGEELGLSFCK